MVLDSGHFDPLWEGTVRGAKPDEWSGRNLLFGLRDWKESGVWSLDTKKVTWRATGQRCVAGDELAVFSPGRGIQIHDVISGEMRRTLPTQVAECRRIQFMKGLLLLTTRDERVVIDASNGREMCRSRADAEVRELLPDRDRRFEVAAHEADEPGRAILHDPEGAAGLLDLRSGRLAWKRLLPFRAGPIVGSGRITYFAGGHITVLDQKTGATLIEATRVTDTYWETVARDGESLLVADENGNLVTLGILDGRVLSSQREAGKGFSWATIMGGRLFVQGTQDGALWVYERNPHFADRGTQTVGKQAATKRPRPTRSARQVAAAKRQGTTNGRRQKTQR